MWCAWPRSRRVRPTDALLLLLLQEYWNIRDNLVEGETAIARALGYELNPPPAAAFLLNYCRALSRTPPHSPARLC